MDWQLLCLIVFMVTAVVYRTFTAAVFVSGRKALASAHGQSFGIAEAVRPEHGRLEDETRQAETERTLACLLVHAAAAAAAATAIATSPHANGKRFMRCTPTEKTTLAARQRQ